MTVLTVIVAVVAAWAGGPLGHSKAPTPTPTHLAPIGSTNQVHSALPAPSPSPAGSAAVSAGAPSSVATAPPTDSKAAWAKHDSAILSASTAPYYIAGTIFGDPPGNHFGVTTMNSKTSTPLIRSASSGATLVQLEQAVSAIHGTTNATLSKAGGGKVKFRLPTSMSIVIDTYGSVRINGKDALGLRKTAAGWTSTATGPQVRAFLAGYIEGEGSAKGMIGDDPAAVHLQYIAHVMATPQAYSVPTRLTGTRYFRLWVENASYYPRVQAYPFSTYSRVPGGKP